METGMMLLNRAIELCSLCASICISNSETRLFCQSCLLTLCYVLQMTGESVQTPDFSRLMPGFPALSFPLFFYFFPSSFFSLGSIGDILLNWFALKLV